MENVADLIGRMTKNRLERIRTLMFGFRTLEIEEREKLATELLDMIRMSHSARVSFLVDLSKATTHWLHSLSWYHETKQRIDILWKRPNRFPEEEKELVALEGKVLTEVHPLLAESMLTMLIETNEMEAIKRTTRVLLREVRNRDKKISDLDSRIVALLNIRVVKDDDKPEINYPTTNS